MARTSLTVLFGKNALNMRIDFVATVNAGGEQPLALAQDLENENVQGKYATYETDYWLLNGEHLFVAPNASIGYMSTGVSGSGGVFATAPEIQLDFGQGYSTNGLTLHFSEKTGEWCDDIDISYYAPSTYSLIRTDSYTPTGTTFATGQAVSNFARIKITFNSTNQGYRFAKLINLDLDTLVRWSGGNIQDAILVEELNVLSIQIPSNKLEFTLHSDDADFSVLAPANEYAALELNEPIEAYEQIDDVSVFLGRFYLQDWETINAMEAHFTAVDAISLMDEPKFYCTANGASVTGIYYYDELIAKIMEAAGVEYEIDASLLDISAWATYSGMLKVMSCRSALQQACFALGAMVTCARSRVIRIIPFEMADSGSTFDLVLDSTNKGDSPVKLRKAFTAIETKSWDYSRVYYTVAYNVLWQQVDVPNGTYIFEVQTPTLPWLYNDDTDLPVDPTDYGRYWIKFIINDTTPTDYAIIDGGYYFDDLPKRYFIDNNTVPTTTPTNVIKIDEGRLVKEDDYPYSQVITQTLQRLVTYYRSRVEETVETYGMDITVGQLVNSDSDGTAIYGIVERTEIKLTSGFTAKSVIVGDITRSTQSVKYDHTHERFTYQGFPNTDTNASDYGGSIKTSPNGTAGFIEFFFIGLQLKVIYRQQTSQGSVTIYIDDISDGVLDQNGTTAYQQEWTSSLLANTYHKVRIEKVGTTGIVNLDGIEVFYK